MKNKTSLYECFNAKVLGDEIHCSEGHYLGANKKNGTISTLRLQRGEPLEFTICQKCPDFERIGNHLEPNDRGWQPLG